MKAIGVLSKYNFMCNIFCFLTIFIVTSTSSKQYRLDYVYNRKTDAFYKFHLEPMTCASSMEICGFEGATLMVPKNEEDISQAHGMFKQYPDIEDKAWILNDGKQHDSIEEIPLINLDQDIHSIQRAEAAGSSPRGECDVIKRNGETHRFACDRRLPFVCKVDAKDAYFDERCKVFARGYTYFGDVGSCYRIAKFALPWNSAYSECRAEGAHLIVLNSELEHQVIYNFTNQHHVVLNAWTPWFFYAGIRAEDSSPLVFKTIFNQTMEEAGYSQWCENEPNNDQGHEFCVTIMKNNGNYNDVYCEEKYGFICEKEV